MLHVLGCITGEHDLRLVVLAGLLCAFASWTAVSLVSRARVSAGNRRVLWTVASGAVFGAGIWATHFVAMLAWRSTFPVGYHIELTALSIAIAIVVSTAGLALMLRRGLGTIGGATVGVAISATHFTGMAALKGPFDLVWNGNYVVGSVVAGVALAAAGGLVNVSIKNMRGRTAAAALLTLGICAMHFTAMSAVTLVPDSRAEIGRAVLAPGMLAVSVAAIAALIVALALVAAWLDSLLALRRSNEAARLRAYITELEATKISLEATSRDLTRALASAAAASEAKSAFLAAMSHELRTPLNAVIGFSELLMTETFGPVGSARNTECVSDIHRSASHLLSMINDVLDLSRLDAGGVPLDDANLALGDIVGETLRMVAPHADRAGVTLYADIAPDLPQARVDKRRMRQVVLNLLTNATKFTPPGGNCRISMRETTNGVELAIADTGIGIANEDIPRALERFGQVDNRLSRKYEGTGLGLPLAKQLVELHGGTLWINSAVNAGTTITVTIPASRVVRRLSAAAA